MRTILRNVYVTNHILYDSYIFLYIIKRKQVDIVFSLCKVTYIHHTFLLQMCITYLVYMFVTNTKVKRV